MSIPLTDHSAVVASECTKQLNDLLAELNKKRGSAKLWMEREIIMSKWVAGCGNDYRILCRGEVRTNNHHYPSILVYDVIQNIVKAFAPTGNDNEVTPFVVGYFYPTSNIAAAAKEVYLSKDGNNDTI